MLTNNISGKSCVISNTDLRALILALSKFPLCFTDILLSVDSRCAFHPHPESCQLINEKKWVQLVHGLSVIVPRKTCVWILSPFHSSYMTTGELFKLSNFPFPFLNPQNRGNKLLIIIQNDRFWYMAYDTQQILKKLKLGYDI